MEALEKRNKALQNFVNVIDKFRAEFRTAIDTFLHCYSQCEQEHYNQCITLIKQIEEQ